jgi:hypothetical protein
VELSLLTWMKRMNLIGMTVLLRLAIGAIAVEATDQQGKRRLMSESR